MSKVYKNSKLIEVNNHKKRLVFSVIFLLIIVFTACSPKAGNSILKFFFDGVPEKSKTDSLSSSMVATPDSLIKTNTQAISSPATAGGIYYHTPYKERACSKCHNAEAPGKSQYSQDEICYTCHADFKQKYTYVHGPVAAGFCTTCHAPHFSENKKLLLYKGQNICLNCHTKELIMQNEVHTDIGKSSCTECHNPHGGSDRFILN